MGHRGLARTVAIVPQRKRQHGDQHETEQQPRRKGERRVAGKLDDPTREGLGKYQDANGLKVTKTLNAVTLEKMGITLTAAQKENVAAQAAYDAAKAPKK